MSVNTRTFEFIHAEPHGDNNILLIAREGHDGPDEESQKVELLVDDFEPYFFVRVEDEDKARGLRSVVRVEGGQDDFKKFESIEGDEICKVVLEHPGATRSARNKFTKTWESDIPYTMRFRIDVGLKSVFQVQSDMLRDAAGENRYRVSTFAIDPLDEEPEIAKRNFYFDIEVGGDEYKGPFDDDLAPITCITAWDNYEEKLISWVWRHDFEVETEEDTYYDETSDKIVGWEKRRYDSEMKLLSNFFEHFVETQYDVISSWYGDKYDIPYVINRARELGLEPESWSPMGIVQDGSGEWEQAKIAGIFMNDLERRYDNIEGGKSSALDYVAEKEVGFYWEQESSNIQEIWENDPERMLEYNANDVIATKAVDIEAGVTEFFFEKMYRTGTRVEEVEKASKVIDYYHMFEAEASEKLPQKGQYDAADFGGAVVFEPEMEGVEGPVAVLDLSKIYPSIMITLNLAYEKFCGRDLVQVNEPVEIPDGENHHSFTEDQIIDPGDLGKAGRMNLWDRLYDLQNDGNLEKTIDWEFVRDEGSQVGDHDGERLPNGVRMDFREDGLTVRVLREMFNLRYYYEDQRQALDQDDPNYQEKWDRLTKKRQVMKDTINAVYGVMGYHKFRLFRPEIAETVTFVGRNLLEMCRRVTEERLGHEVVYGDTDSIMVLLEGYDYEEDKEAVIEEGKRVGEAVNDAMDEFARNFCGVEDHMYELEFEKLYRHMFQGDKKKRYAGYVVWNEDAGYLEEPYIDIKGFEYKRSEAPPIVAKLQKNLFDTILIDRAGKEAAIDVVEELYLEVQQGRASVFDVARAPSLGDLDGYESLPAHAKAATFTNRFFDDVEISSGDDVYYVYVNETGFNHDGKSLPDTTKYIGMVEDMEPPQAQVQCRNCDHDWVENEFVSHIQHHSECPECGHNSEDAEDGKPFYVQGCRVDWDKYAKDLKSKARKVLSHLGWEGELHAMGDQDTTDEFYGYAG